MILVSIALPNEGEAYINPEMIECIRAPKEPEEGVGAVIEFASGLSLRVRDDRTQVLTLVLDAMEPPKGKGKGKR